MGETGLTPSQRGNENLTWEKLWTTNIGLRLGFFNRVNFTAEFYNKLTTDMLMQVPVSYADGGYGSYWDNVGAMVNRGIGRCRPYPYQEFHMERVCQCFAQQK